MSKHRIYANYDGCKRLLIVLHDPDLAEEARQAAAQIQNAEDAIFLVREFSERAFDADQGSIKATNNNYARLRAQEAEKPLNREG